MGRGGKRSPATEFKKGVSGNPAGRPKQLPKLDVLLAEVLGDEKDGITAGQAILMKLRQKALNGDIRAAQLLLDRGYGKAKQTIELHTPEPIKIEVVPYIEPITSEDDLPEYEE